MALPLLEYFQYLLQLLIFQVRIGGKVPKSYYLSEVSNMDPEKTETITIGAGSSHSIEFKVTHPGMVIRYGYQLIYFLC